MRSGAPGRPQAPLITSGLDDHRVEPYLKLIDKYKAALTIYENLHDDLRAKDVVIFLALAVNHLGLLC